MKRIDAMNSISEEAAWKANRSNILTYLASAMRKARAGYYCFTMSF